MSYESMLEAAPGRESTRTGAVAAFVCGLWMAALAILAQPAFAAVAATDGAAPANSRLASLRVDIWPEFDRPAALIILKGELPPDAPLPAAVSLRIPAAVGRPAAVAFANAAGSELFNLPYEASTAGDFTTVRFSAPQRFFHVEYYDTLETASSLRNYTYVWRGDLAVNRLSVSLQEPAAASGLSVLPDLGPGTAGPDGLIYRTTDLGAHEAGKQLVVAIRYAKADARTSAEILKLGTPAAQSPAPAGGTAPVSRLELALVIAGAVLALVGLGLAGWWLTSRRTRAAFAAQPAAAGFCSHCGNALAAGDRFCSSCGKPAGKRKS